MSSSTKSTGSTLSKTSRNSSSWGSIKAYTVSVIKYLLSRKCKLSEEPIYLIMSLPFLMDFETKKKIFHSQIKALNEQRYMVSLKSRSTARISSESPTIKSWQGQVLNFEPVCVWSTTTKAPMTLEDSLVTGSSPSARRCLTATTPCLRQVRQGILISPAAIYVNPDHLKYFKFVGRVVGKALSERENVDAFFTRSFYKKLILGQELELNDLEETGLRIT